MNSQVQKLLEIGFEKVGSWALIGERLACELTSHHGDSNVLYVFVVDGEIAYVGKTFGRLKVRMRGYEFPEASQSTNVKNNRLIREAITAGSSVEIVALADRGILSYGGFHLNLASGLEQSIISSFLPRWNGSQKNQSVTQLTSTSAQLESAMPRREPTVRPTPNVTLEPSGDRKPSARGWTERFRSALRDAFQTATAASSPFIDIRAGELHKSLSQGRNRMPLCCNAMHQMAREGDEILEGPPSGLGSRLLIRYKIPRS
ncbi:MAG: GIY-YIG nuclease family protein [Lysobacterales bacterium]